MTHNHGWNDYLIGEVGEQRLISPALHLLASHGSELLVFCSLELGIQSAQQSFMNIEDSARRFILNLEVGEIWMDTQSQVRRQCPWCGCPC